MFQKQKQELIQAKCELSRLNHTCELLEDLRLSQNRTIKVLTEEIAGLRQELEACKKSFRTFVVDDDCSDWCKYCRYFPGDTSTVACRHDCDRYTHNGFEWGMKNEAEQET